MTKKEITRKYREWRKANGNKKPNRVLVNMWWEDESPEDKCVDVIALRSCDINTENVKDDAGILWYASGLRGLLELTSPDNGSDFVVSEVIEFYKK